MIYILRYDWEGESTIIGASSDRGRVEDRIKKMREEYNSIEYEIEKIRDEWDGQSELIPVAYNPYYLTVDEVEEI